MKGLRTTKKLIRQGSSLVLIVTKEAAMLNLKEGQAMEITIDISEALKNDQA